MNIKISCEEKLRLLNEEFESFSYIVSHDIKAPLRAVKNLTTWINEDLEDNNLDDVKSNLKMLGGRVERLQEMMDSITEFSKIKKSQLTVSQYNVKEHLTNIFSLYPKEIEFELGDIDIVFPTYTNKLDTVLYNVIDNGIKFNNSEIKKIGIKVEQNSNYLIISIEDNGMGISADHFERIFGMFYTLVPKDKSENIGAGLAIVKKITDFVEGKVEIESEINKGSIFKIFWPINLETNG